VALPGRVDNLSTTGDTILAPVRTANASCGSPSPPAPWTRSHSPADRRRQHKGNQTLVALHDTKSVAVLNGDTTTHTITGLSSADQALPVGDKPSSSTASAPPSSTSTPPPAPSAPACAPVTAPPTPSRQLRPHPRHDSRGGELLVYNPTPSSTPALPVPGTPYGIAYDPDRHLAWVTLTATNQVVAYDVAGGEPVEKHRLTTVRQPNSVAVDPTTGRCSSRPPMEEESR